MKKRYRNVPKHAKVNLPEGRETILRPNEKVNNEDGRAYCRLLAVVVVVCCIGGLVFLSYPGFKSSSKKTQQAPEAPAEGENTPRSSRSNFMPRQYMIHDTPMEAKLADIISHLSREVFPSLEISLMLEELFETKRTEEGYVQLLYSYGLRFLNMERYKQGLLLFEKYFAIKLGVEDWSRLVESIIDQDPNEWVFLYDIGDNLTDYLALALKCCLYTQEYHKADHLYRLVIGLSGAANTLDYTKAYASFSISIGNVWTAMENYRLNSVGMFVAAGLGDDQDAHNVISSHALRLFTSGLPMYAAALTRSLILGRDRVWQVLKTNCHLETSPLAHSTYYRMHFAEVVDLFSQCAQRDRVVPRLLEEGAVVYASNLFGWVPLLQAAFVGSEAMVEDLLRGEADPLAQTELGHTALHIVAMHGRLSLVPRLLEAGVPPGAVDYFNRTALDVACLHGRATADRLASLLGSRVPSPAPCSRKRLSHRGGKMSNGGWLPSYVALPLELTEERCDFDSVADLDADSFLYNYLLLQRPVVIRNAVNPHLLEKFLRGWERNNFEKQFGFMDVPYTDVPLSQQLGLPSEHTFLSTVLQTMRTLYQRKSKRSDAISGQFSKIAYASLPEDSPLLEGFQVPDVLDANTTHISYEGVLKYLYLGNVASGFNMGYGKSAWDLLVYGQKRWFLHPPTKAYFATDSAWYWWRTEYRHGEEEGLECMQNAGDLFFVPEMWSKATLHLRETVGLFQEFVHGPTEFSI